MKRPSRITPFIVPAAFLVCGLLLLADAPGNEALYARLQRQAPEGFLPSQPPQLYGTTERPLRDGTIFNFMDGGGIAFLEHGYREMFHAEYSGDGGLAVTLDVFSMVTADHALTALADDRICPAGGMPASFATGGRVFRFPPDYYIYFPIGRHIVYLHVNDDRKNALLDRFAVEIIQSVEENLK